MKNFIKDSNLLFALILIFMIGACGERKVITWHGHIEKEKVGYKLINKFSCLIDTSFIVDQKAFSYLCHYFEDVDTDSSLDEIAAKTKLTQVVIENKNGSKRLFSEMYAEATETKDISFVNCMTDWDTTVDLIKDHVEQVEIEFDYLSDLKVTPEDKYIRLHYMFKPNDEQIKKGFDSEIRLTSNWIAIDPRWP